MVPKTRPQVSPSTLTASLWTVINVLYTNIVSVYSDHGCHLIILYTLLFEISWGICEPCNSKSVKALRELSGFTLHKKYPSCGTLVMRHLFIGRTSWCKYALRGSATFSLLIDLSWYHESLWLFTMSSIFFFPVSSLINTHKVCTSMLWFVCMCQLDWSRYRHLVRILFHVFINSI